MSLHSDFLAIDRLQVHWSQQQSRSLRLNEGVTQAEIRAFESANDVVLPHDFAAYLREFNGFRPPDDDDESWEGLDDEAFDFYSLSKLLPADQSRKYFVFSQWEFGVLPYAICMDPLGRHGQVVTVRADLHVIAPSFSEFIHLYVDDAKALYAPSQEMIPYIAVYR